MAKKTNASNNKYSTGFSTNPFIRAFQASWLWFKETAWVQVVLVVILVFGVVFSIPYIIEAATADSDEDAEYIDYLEDRRKNYKNLNEQIKKTNTQTGYTVVYFYSPDDSSSTGIGYYLKDGIFSSDAKKNNYYQENLYKSLVTVDVTRTYDADEDDYDFTSEQLDQMSYNMGLFYDSSINNKTFTTVNAKTYTYGSSSTSWHSKVDSSNTGVLSVPANTWAIYKNDASNELLETEPVFAMNGFSTSITSGDPGNFSTFTDEFGSLVDHFLGDDGFIDVALSSSTTA